MTLFRNLAQHHPRIAAAVWFALAAAILPGIAALALLGWGGGGSSPKHLAEMYSLMMNHLAFAMYFTGRGLKGEEYMWLLSISPLISAALAGWLAGASILAEDTITAKQAGTRGVLTAYGTYCIHIILTIVLGHLVAEGRIVADDILKTFAGGITMLVFILVLASVALIPMGYAAGWLLYKLSAETVQAREPLGPLP